MNIKTIAAYGQIQVRVLQAMGMEAENQYYIQGGMSPVYTAGHFQELAVEIEEVIKDLNSNQDTPVQPIQYDSNFTAEDPC